MSVRRPRPLLLALLASVVAVPLLAVPTNAVAEDEATGDVVVGTLVQAWSERRHDHAAGGPTSSEAEAQLLSWVEPESGEPVRVPTEDLPEVVGLASGATVEVTLGSEVVDEPAAHGLDEATEALDVDLLTAAPRFAAAGGYANEITVVLVRPGGIAPPAEAPTRAEVVDAIGPATSFWMEQTDSEVAFSPTVSHDWISTTATCANPEALFREVDTRVNWPGGENQHLMLYIPPNAPGCGDGLATVGTGLDGGGYLYVTDLLPSLISHELGHNLGLGHASALQCDGTVEGSTEDCALFPYFDLYDVMGLSWDRMGSLNTAHADRLGLLDPLSVESFSVLGDERTVTVHALDQVGVNGGVRLVDPVTGLWEGVEYWLEYRYPRGRDAWLGDPATNLPDLDSGVLLHLAQDADDTSLLLDGTPSPEADWTNDLQAALPVGTPVPVAGGAFVVTVQSLGSTSASVRIQPRSPIVAAHERAGGATGPLGAESGTPTCLPDGGCYQRYEGGSVYWSAATGAHALQGPVLAKWNAAGSELSPLGYPITDLACGYRDGGCFQRFEGGRIYWSPATGAHVVPDETFGPWGARSYERGFLGYPITDPACGYRDGGCFQRFEGGRIYWSPATGARVVRNETFGPWGTRSYERGFLGYPLNDTVCGLRDGGCFQRFQGGSLYASRSGTGAVKGHIYNRWAAGQWERGRLGYPRGDEACSAGRCIQHFQRGRIAWTGSTGARQVVGGIGAHWGHGYGSPQGFPTTDERCGLVRGGCFQRFQYASIYWSPATGAHTVGLRSPQVARAWAAQSWERGRLGYPAGPEVQLRYGWSQRFQGGTLVWDSRTNRVTRR